jgi:nitroreductase
MKLYDVFTKRRSIRSFTDEPVSKETLNKLANAVHLAPSACNRQPYKFIAVTSPELKAQLCEVVSQSFIKEAPVIIIGLVNTSAAWVRAKDNKSMADTDLAIAMEHLVLAATAENLGTCWVASFDVAKVNEILGVTGDWTSQVLTPVGYAKDGAQEFFRTKNIADIFEVI